MSAEEDQGKAERDLPSEREMGQAPYGGGFNAPDEPVPRRGAGPEAGEWASLPSSPSNPRGRVRFKERESMRRLSIPVNPADERFLADRLGNVAFQLFRLCNYISTLPPEVEDPDGARAVEWAQEHPAQAEEIIQETVEHIEDVCNALRSQRFFEYLTPTNQDRRSRAAVQWYEAHRTSSDHSDPQPGRS